jgi:glycine hydroxymethyltransferase
VAVFGSVFGFTGSHQFGLEAAPYGGGHRASLRLRRANLLASAIGLPLAPVAADSNGIRIGTPELVRFGMKVSDMGSLAGLIAEALRGEVDLGELAGRVTALRQSFTHVHFVS